MAIIKCKMCGGDLDIADGTSVCECEYCGTRQTVPSLDNEKKLTLFARANRLRLASEFDKASGIYESIVAEFPEEAEAYWGLVLCKYGIEYVDDPATGKKIPTCHRSSFDSIMDDTDFEQACENADGAARKVYRKEAKQIEELRKGILEVSGKEEPYDIFICYKETDENGNRTLDSVLAQDIYDALTAKGCRVFFSRITLEDKLGQEYEPYIFAALNSAKIMLAVGTDYEYYNAVWVKNEWSRYLKLMVKDKNKHLIPCYKNLDAYDMPKEFAKLQAQDLGKVGAMQDLLRGIEKILGGTIPSLQKKQEDSSAAHMESPKAAALLKRGMLLLEDQDWEIAVSYFDRVLDINPECGQAYLGKVLAEEHVPSIQAFTKKMTEKPSSIKPVLLDVPIDSVHIENSINRFSVPGFLSENQIKNLYDFKKVYPSEVSGQEENLHDKEKFFKENRFWARAVQFADENFAEELALIKTSALTLLKKKVDTAKQAEEEAKATAERQYMEMLQSGDQQAEKLYNQADWQRAIQYERCIKKMSSAIDRWTLRSIEKEFYDFGNYRDAKKLCEECRRKIKDTEAGNREAQQENLRMAQGKCRYCGGTFKGIFKKVCAQCGKPKDY